LVKRPDLYRERPESWLGLLYKLARFRILDRRTARSRVASIEELFELAGEVPFEKARPCVAVSPADEDARYAAPPINGERWSREQIVGALQRFRDRTGRPPEGGRVQRAEWIAQSERHLQTLRVAGGCNPRRRHGSRNLTEE
jgi:hypothetical protein